jgi:hypothetical protein
LADLKTFEEVGVDPDVLHHCGADAKTELVEFAEAYWMASLVPVEMSPSDVAAMLEAGVEVAGRARPRG